MGADLQEFGAIQDKLSAIQTLTAAADPLTISEIGDSVNVAETLKAIGTDLLKPEFGRILNIDVKISTLKKLIGELRMS